MNAWVVDGGGRAPRFEVYSSVILLYKGLAKSTSRQSGVALETQKLHKDPEYSLIKPHAALHANANKDHHHPLISESFPLAISSSLNPPWYFSERESTLAEGMEMPIYVLSVV